MTAYSEEGCMDIKGIKYKYFDYDLSYNEIYNVSSA